MYENAENNLCKSCLFLRMPLFKFRGYPLLQIHYIVVLNLLFAITHILDMGFLSED